MERKFTLSFVSSADLAAAQAAEQAVKRIGDAADKSTDKLDAFEKEWKERLDAVKKRVENAQQDLEKGGEAAGQGAGRGMGKGLELAANTHLIGQAWQIGSMIGAKLGEALVMAHEGGMEDLKTSLLAGLGVWSAQVDEELERQKETLPAKYREINEKLKRESKAFWDEMLGLKPKTATDWMDELITKADTLQAKLRGIVEVQTAAMKIGQSQVQQDYLDKKQDIMLSSDPESVKARRLGALEQQRLEQEAALRSQQRQQQVQAATQGLGGKESDLKSLQGLEAEQKRRADAYDKASTQANSDIASRRAGGQQVTDEDAIKIREQYFKQISATSGIQLNQNVDEQAELKQLKKRREALEKEVEKLRVDTLTKQQVIALEEANDQAVTEREKKRVFRESENQATKALREERETQERQKQERLQYEQENRPQAAPSPPVDANLEQLKNQLGQAAGATGNSALKMDLEAAKRALSDGASADELKEVAALMQRAGVDNSEAVRQLAQTMRTLVEAQMAKDAATKAEMAQIKAQVEAWKNNRS